MKTVEKNAPIAVVGFRYNPQLGTYVTGPYFGRIARVNKNSFDKDSDNEFYPKTFNFYGHAVRSTNCVYGSISYEVHTLDETRDILRKQLDRYPVGSFKYESIKKMVDNIDRANAV